MKGEIIRRMSMEIIKDDVVNHGDSVTKEKEEEVEEDDYLVKTIGSIGLWQGIVGTTVSLTRAVAAWNVMSIPFLTPVVDFICVEFRENVSTEVKKSVCYDNCSNYNYSSAIGRSIIEDFDLICQNAWLASFTQSVLMMGFVVGVSLFGWISDRFGRRKALLQSTFFNAVCMIALSFSPSYIIFAAIRFMIGIATGGSMFICVVYIMEIIGRRQIEVAGVGVLIPECLAGASLAAFSYFTSDWKGYTLSLGLATCIIFVLILFVPETPRWLMANGKIDEAIKVITSAAKRNKLDTSSIQAEITKAFEDMKVNESEIIKTSYIDFFKSKDLFMPTFVLFVIWFALCLCFYGIYQYVTVIGANIYLTVVILSLMQIPILPVGVFLNRTFGRKASTTGLAVCMAAALLALAFIQKGHWLATVMGSIAFISSNICFSISYVHMSELYPTPLRNMSYGLASCGAKLGAMIAPFVVTLLPRWVPSIIFCVFAVIAGFLVLALRETKGQNLKDVIEK